MELASPPRWPASPFARPCLAWTPFAWSAVRHTTRHTRVRARTRYRSGGHSPQLAAEAARHTMVTIKYYLAALLFTDAAEAVPVQVAVRVQGHGGVGLRSAVRHAPAVFWASWADTLPTLLKRDRTFAIRFVQHVDTACDLSKALPLQTARLSLSAVGFVPPSWHDLLHGEEPAATRPRRVPAA